MATVDIAPLSTSVSVAALHNIGGQQTTGRPVRSMPRPGERTMFARPATGREARLVLWKKQARVILCRLQSADLSVKQFKVPQKVKFVKTARTVT